MKDIFKKQQRKFSLNSETFKAQATESLATVLHKLAHRTSASPAGLWVPSG